MPHLGRVVGLAILVCTVSLSGCFVGEEDRAVTVSKGVDADRDGAAEWLGVRLQTIEGASPRGADLSARVIDPTGAVNQKICQTPAIERYVCEEPLQPGDPWRQGATVFLPCSGEGENTFEIAFERGLQLTEAHDCGESPHTGP